MCTCATFYTYVCGTTPPAVAKGRQQRLARTPQCYAVTWMGKKASDVMIALGECMTCIALEYTGGPPARSHTVAESLPAASDTHPACLHVCYALKGVPLLVLHNHTERLSQFTHSTYVVSSAVLNIPLYCYYCAILLDSLQLIAK